VTIQAEDDRGTWSDTLTIAIGDEICLTPPLGWNSWHAFGPTVSEADIRRAADLLVASGLADLGWVYVNIDDGWQGGRDSHGRLHPNEKFGDPAALVADLHALGLKVGIYSSPGATTCAGLPGSLGHEVEDAASFAAWGFDYLKYDWCSAGPHTGRLPVHELAAPFARMRAALDGLDRDIIYHICEYGWRDVWIWARERTRANAWRTTGDIEDSWESVDRIGFGQADLHGYAGPGGWNDPDMLVVGRVGGAWSQPLHASNLTADEARSHLGLWALLSAPLLLGCDLGGLDPEVTAMIASPDLLAINQDELGRQARRVRTDGTAETWRKDLSGGATALGVFNRGASPTDVAVDWPELGIRTPDSVRDVWTGQELDAPDGWPARLPPHGTAILLLRPSSPR
jgi:alpha-galactosidase